MGWRKYWREHFIFLIIFVAVAYSASLEPIPQKQTYHQFADTSAFGGVPNLFNVASNLVFVIVGIAGFYRLKNQAFSPAVNIWRFMFISVVLVGLGSTWYHLNPTNESLFWDRLPMSVGFASMIAGICADRICCKTGCRICVPLIIFSMATVIYWIYTENAGTGDLRPYLMLQYLSIALIPVIIVLYPQSLELNRPYLLLWGFYVIAKLCELYDSSIYEGTGRLLSGHTLKHLAAAAGLYLFRPYPQSNCFRVSRPVAVILFFSLLLLQPNSYAASQAELDESHFLTRAMVMSVAAHPGRASEILQENLRQKEKWQFASYIIEEGTVEAEILAAWRPVPDGSFEYWLAVAGSNSFNDWFLDFDTGKVNFAKQNRLSAPYNKMHLHRGFHIHTQAIMNLPIRTPSGTDELLSDFLLRNPAQKIVLAGHCLGGAAVVILSTRLISLGVKPEQIKAVTFGAPAVGDQTFARHFEKIVDMTRVVTKGDPIPLVPPRALYGYVHWGRLVNWEMPEFPFWERHYKKHHHDLAIRKEYDLKKALGHEVIPSSTGMVYIAAIQNELPFKWGGDDFPYMKQVLYETYQDLFGSFTIHPEDHASMSDFEKLRNQAAQAGSKYLLFASVWGQRYENAVFPYTLITLDQSLFRVSDGSLVYAASYQDAARQFTPLIAVSSAATIMNTDADFWLERKR